MEGYDFSGKKIVLFVISGGSGFGKTVDGLKNSVATDTVIKEGELLNGQNSETDQKMGGNGTLRAIDCLEMR